MFLFTRAALPARNCERYAPDIAARLRARRSRGARARPGFHARRRDALRGLPQRVDRLRGDGEDRRCGGGAARCRLERRRLLGGAARGQRRRTRDGNVHPRRCARRGHARLLPVLPRAGWSRSSAWTTTWWSRPRMRCWWRRRIACRTSRSWSRACKARGPQRALAAPRGVPALGQLRQPRQRRALPGEAPDGQPGRRAVAAAASSPRRALGRGVGHGAHHARRGGVPARRRTSRPTSRSASRTASRTRARSRCTSSRCSRATIWARTTSCASRTATGARARPS